MKNLLSSLSTELQAKLKDFKVSEVFVCDGEVNTTSEYDLDYSYIEAIEKELSQTEAQKKAREILVRNNHFAGGNVPFDKTSNYIGMQKREINNYPIPLHDRDMDLENRLAKRYDRKPEVKEPQMVIIADLKKGDEFKFNDRIYKVKRKFLGDDKYNRERPLITYCKDRFYSETLIIEKV